jgi:hypothetical protein
LTALERLSARPSAIHPYRRRATGRNAEVRSNSDNDRHDVRPKIQNGPAFSHLTGVRAPRTVAPRPGTTLQAICRLLKSHR